MKSILSIAMVAISVSLFCQGDNFTDADGRKQGHWKKFYEGTTSPFYEGQFKDDKPIGQFTYYYKDGLEKGIMRYRKDGYVDNKTFYPKSSQLMASGRYADQKKDSIWNYYSEAGLLTSSEEWDIGAKHGLEKVFFDNGVLAELTTHIDGLRNGVWEQYYENGQVKVSGTFIKDELEGEIDYFFKNGAKEIKGRFKGGLREGTWMYFNKDGSIRYQAVYREGDIVKEKRENGIFEERGPDDILLSSHVFKKGLKEGPFKEYHDQFSYEYEDVVDKLTGETYMRQVLLGNELKREGTYKADELEGEVKIYNEKGILVERENYINGELQ